MPDQDARPAEHTAALNGTRAWPPLHCVESYDDYALLQKTVEPWPGSWPGNPVHAVR